MFTTQEERDNAQRSYVIDLPAAEISDFPDHLFKVRMDEEMEQMVESVKERGVLSPVLVRPMPDGGYQMVSGHRRKLASELAELPTVPCMFLYSQIQRHKRETKTSGGSSTHTSSSGRTHGGSSGKF